MMVKEEIATVLYNTGPTQVTIDDGDLMAPINTHLSVMPLDGDSPLTSSTLTGATVSVCELKSKWELNPPPDCPPPPPPPPFAFDGEEEMPPLPAPPPPLPAPPPPLNEEEEEDIYQKIVFNRHLEECNDSDLVNDYVDSEPDDFTVHFVHHGKKEEITKETSKSDNMDLLAQITELQDSVSTIKSSLTEAVTRLTAAVSSPTHSATCGHHPEKCDSNTAEVLRMVLSLKNEMSSLRKDVSDVCERQDNLQKTVEKIAEKEKKENRRSREVIRPSGSQSNDSGVALLLERAYQAFSTERLTDSSPANSTAPRTSDQDSLPDQPSLLVPPSVYDYVATLNNRNNTLDSDEVLGYDSDSSITMAANKSLNLSSTISKELRAGIQGSESNHKGVNKSSANVKYSSDGSSESDQVSRNEMSVREMKQNARRKRHEKSLSVSSTSKLYGTVNRSVSQDSSPYQAVSVYDGAMYSQPSGDTYGSTGDTYGSKNSNSYSLKPESLSYNSRNDNHRCRVARDLLETEKKYCRTLWIIQDTFAEPLKKSGILTANEINTLFPPEIYQLYDKHCHLQHQLRERLASWQWQPIVGDILSKFTNPSQSDVLRLYTSYVNDFPEIMKIFSRLCASSTAFTNYIKSCLDQPSCRGSDLSSFLLTPVQRIPRYILLLKQLLKFTEESHPDFHNINVCINRLKDFLDKLNESIENSFQLVQSSFGYPRMDNSCARQEAEDLNLNRTYDRVGRSPRRTKMAILTSTNKNTPERLTSRSEERLDATSPDLEDDGTDVRRRNVTTSPKRSISMAGGGPNKGLNIQKRRQKTSESAMRSRSLPRNMAEKSSTECENVKESSIANVKSLRPQRPLPTSQSVADITKSAALDMCDTDILEVLDDQTDSLESEEPIHEVTMLDYIETSKQDGGAECQENTHAHNNQDGHLVKKKSLKSSIKNIFTFKKSQPLKSPQTNGAESQSPCLAVSRQNTPTPIKLAPSVSVVSAMDSSIIGGHHLHYHPHDHHHYHHPHHYDKSKRRTKDESDYWDPRAQSVDSTTRCSKVSPSSEEKKDCTGSKCCSQNCNPIYQPLSTISPALTMLTPPQPPSTPIPGANEPMSVVGDFVDEDGNPCSNV